MADNLEIIERRRDEIDRQFEEEFSGDLYLKYKAALHYAAVQENIIRKLQTPTLRTA